MAFGGGYGGVKLYFMIGLPTETPEDVAGIADLAQKVVKAYYETPKEGRNRNLKVTVSTSSFCAEAIYTVSVGQKAKQCGNADGEANHVEGRNKGSAHFV